MRLAFERVCEECGEPFNDEHRWDVEYVDGSATPYPLVPNKYLGLCDSCLWGNQCEECGDFTLANDRVKRDEVDGFYVYCKSCWRDLILSPEEQHGA